MKKRIKSFFDSKDTNSPESWRQGVEQDLREIHQFYNENDLDDLTDTRLKNKVPDVADRLHQHVLYAPDGINQDLRRQLFVISKNHTEITLLFDMEELEKGIEKNRKKDDQRANEIIAEVLINERLHDPVKQGLKIIEEE